LVGTANVANLIYEMNSSGIELFSLAEALNLAGAADPDRSSIDDKTGKPSWEGETPRHITALIPKIPVNGDAARYSSAFSVEIDRDKLFTQIDGEIKKIVKTKRKSALQPVSTGNSGTDQQEIKRFLQSREMAKQIQSNSKFRAAHSDNFDSIAEEYQEFHRQKALHLEIKAKKREQRHLHAERTSELINRMNARDKIDFEYRQYTQQHIERAKKSDFHNELQWIQMENVARAMNRAKERNAKKEVMSAMKDRLLALKLDKPGELLQAEKAILENYNEAQNAIRSRYALYSDKTTILPASRLDKRVFPENSDVASASAASSSLYNAPLAHHSRRRSSLIGIRAPLFDPTPNTKEFDEEEIKLTQWSALLGSHGSSGLALGLRGAISNPQEKFEKLINQVVPLQQHTNLVNKYKHPLAYSSSQPLLSPQLSNEPHHDHRSTNRLELRNPAQGENIQSQELNNAQNNSNLGLLQPSLQHSLSAAAFTGSQPSNSSKIRSAPAVPSPAATLGSSASLPGLSVTAAAFPGPRSSLSHHRKRSLGSTAGASLPLSQVKSRWEQAARKKALQPISSALISSLNNNLNSSTRPGTAQANNKTQNEALGFKLAEDPLHSLALRRLREQRLPQNGQKFEEIKQFIEMEEQKQHHIEQVKLIQINQKLSRRRNSTFGAAMAEFSQDSQWEISPNPAEKEAKLTPRTENRREMLSSKPISLSSLAVSSWLRSHGKIAKRPLEPHAEIRYRRMFSELDSDNSGSIEAEEIIAAMKKTHNLHISQQELKYIMQFHNINFKGKLHFNQFVEQFASQSEWDALFQLRQQRKAKKNKKQQKSTAENRNSSDSNAHGEDKGEATEHSNHTNNKKSKDDDVLVPFLLWVPGFHRVKMLESLMSFKWAKDEIAAKYLSAATALSHSDSVGNSNLSAGLSLDELWRITQSEVRAKYEQLQKLEFHRLQDIKSPKGLKQAIQSFKKLPSPPQPPRGIEAPEMNEKLQISEEKGDWKAKVEAKQLQEEQYEAERQKELEKFGRRINPAAAAASAVLAEQQQKVEESPVISSENNGSKMVPAVAVGYVSDSDQSGVSEEVHEGGEKQLRTLLQSLRSPFYYDSKPILDKRKSIAEKIIDEIDQQHNNNNNNSQFAQTYPFF
jgi:hypothetical protein